MCTPLVFSLATARATGVGSAATSCAPRVIAQRAAAEPGTMVYAAPRAKVRLRREDLDLVEKVLGWRTRLGKLVFGVEPTLAQATRAAIAFGGLQDRCIQFLDTPLDELRAASVEGALAALGIEL